THPDRVIAGGDPDLLSQNALEEIQRVCDQLEIPLDFVPRLIGMSAPQKVRTEPAIEPQKFAPVNFSLPRYFQFKRLFDIIGAMVLMLVLLPHLVLASTLALLDVGRPVLFWQQRLGLRGRPFVLTRFALCERRSIG